MSSSLSPSGTSTSPSPTSSHTPHATQSGIQIPTTTVVGIGAGFVCFAISLLGCLLLIRFIRLAIKARRDGIPVRTAWVDQGGFFGWIHGVGPQDSSARERRMEEIERMRSGYWGGGGGWYASEITRMRIWNELRREQEAALLVAKGEGLGERPGMWEVDLAGEKQDEERVELRGYTPLSVIPNSIPLKETTAPPLHCPTINLSLLIALPAPAPGPTAETDTEMDLPELVIGTTTFAPILPHQEQELEKEPIPMLSRVSVDGKAKDMGMEVAHLEYEDEDGKGSDGTECRARWIKVKTPADGDGEEKWVIEGLEDCMTSRTGTGAETRVSVDH